MTNPIEIPEGAETLNLVAGYDNDRAAHEEVLVQQTATGRYRLLRSPGLVLGIAAGDEIELDPSAPGAFRVVSRAGNVSIQFFREHGIEECERTLMPEIRRLRGRLDGKSDRELVFTIPVAVGFPAIEDVFHRVERSFADVEWNYGNVFDPNDRKTPLNWW